MYLLNDPDDGVRALLEQSLVDGLPQQTERGQIDNAIAAELGGEPLTDDIVTALCMQCTTCKMNI